MSSLRRCAGSLQPGWLRPSPSASEAPLERCGRRLPGDGDAEYIRQEGTIKCRERHCHTGTWHRGHSDFQRIRPMGVPNMPKGRSEFAIVSNSACSSHGVPPSYLASRMALTSSGGAVHHKLDRLAQNRLRVAWRLPRVNNLLRAFSGSSPTSAPIPPNPDFPRRRPCGGSFRDRGCAPWGST